MISVTVKDFGEFRVLNRRFWAPELADKAGWEVELHFEEGRMMYPVVWTKGRQHRLCVAAQIDDCGFADVEAAKAASQSSVVRSESGEVSREEDRAPDSRSGIRQFIAKFFRRSIHGQPFKLGGDAFSDAKVAVGQVCKQTEQQEAQLADVVLVHAKAILVHAQAIIDAHDQLNSPSGCYAVSMRGAAKTLISHRLSETSK